MISRMKQAGAIFLGWRNGRRGRWATGGQKRWFDSTPEDHRQPAHAPQEIPMNRADRIAKKKADKRARKMDRCGGQSRYARKFAWLMSHPRPEQRTIVQSDGTVANIEVQRIPWGWEIASPKPWQ